MNQFFKRLLVNVLLALPFLAAAQPIADTSGCVDILRLRDGSVYRGRLIGQTDGTLTFQTWSGAVLQFPENKIRRVVQHCPEEKAPANLPKPYAFRERGWYNATSASALAGQAYWGDNTLGFSLHNSTGYAFSRFLGLGLGFGVDVFSPYEEALSKPVYPVFAEARGYLMRRNVSPFYALGAGWGFAGSAVIDRFGYEDRMRGGWMAYTRLGYRLGDHFTLHAGVRLQRLKRRWTSSWDMAEGLDRILHQRLELGFSLLL